MKNSKILTALGVCAVLSLSMGCDTPGSSSAPNVAADGTTSDAAGEDTAGSDTAGSDTAGSDTAGSDTPASDVASSDAGDNGTPDTPSTGGQCPPAGPFGTAVGSTLADVTVFDCDGNPRQLSELCDRDAAMVITFAGWCSACRSYAESLANMIYDNITSGPQSVESYLVITEKANGSEPDAAYCRDIRDEYQLTMPVFYEPTKAIESTWGVTSNSQEVVLSRGMKVYWKNQGGGWAHPDSVNRVAELLQSL